jgi:osmoprotectant transport system substrate-binding protein
MKTTATRTRAMVAIALAMALALSVSACGGSSSADNKDVILTIASSNYPAEPTILGEIYAQALEGAGYAVKRELGNVSEAQAEAALESGQISAYPLSIKVALLYFPEIEREDIPTEEEQSLEQLEVDLEKNELTNFPPAPYINSYTVGTTRETADRLGLKAISDLEGKAEGLVLSGPPECPEFIECIPGLKKYYDLEFKSFVSEYLGGQYAVLEDGRADLSMLFTTDPQLAGKSKYVALVDDKHVFPAGGRTVLITTQKIADEAGPDFEQAVLEAQQGLTLVAMRKLNAEVELEGKQPAAVAKHFLETQQ